MNIQIVDISWITDGLKIAGKVYVPRDRGRPFPALILCHGIPAKVKGPDDRGYPLLAERFCQEGFEVLIFNFRGAGLSEGNFDIFGWTRDLEGGVDFIARRPEIDFRRIFVMGFSGGAAVSLYVAAQRREIAGVVSCASPAEFRDLTTVQGLGDFLAHARDVGIIKDPEFPGSVENWEKSFEVVKPIDWVNQIPPRPLLIIHGTEDDVVDVSHAHRIYERVKGKAELYIIEGAGHRLRVEERAMDKALKWLSAISHQLSARNI